MIGMRGLCSRGESRVTWFLASPSSPMPFNISYIHSAVNMPSSTSALHFPFSLLPQRGRRHKATRIISRKCATVDVSTCNLSELEGTADPFINRKYRKRLLAIFVLRRTHARRVNAEGGSSLLLPSFPQPTTRAIFQPSLAHLGSPHFNCSTA